MLSLMKSGDPGWISLVEPSVGPFTLRVIGEPERLATVRLTIPAPNRVGATWTRSESTFALTSMGVGDRGLFGKSLAPQPANTKPTSTAEAPSEARRPRREALRAPQIAIDATLTEAQAPGASSAPARG